MRMNMNNRIAFIVVLHQSQNGKIKLETDVWIIKISKKGSEQNLSVELLISHQYIINTDCSIDCFTIVLTYS